MRKNTWALAGRMCLALLLAGGVLWGRCVKSSEAGNDTSSWTGVKVGLKKTEKVRLSLFSQYRTYHDLKDSQFYFSSLKLKYRALSHLDLGVNYTYINVKVNNTAAGRSEYKFQHRAELEGIPFWRLADWLILSIRNRVEFRWIEDQGSFNTRSRHNFKWTIPVKRLSDGWIVLKQVSMATEAFYNYANHRYEEQRTVPVSLRWRLFHAFDWEMYYLIQSRATVRNSDWFDNHVIGTNIFYSF